MGRLYDGTCRLCGERYTGTGISSHVKGCLTSHADVAAVHHGLLVGIRSDGPAGRFWMYVLARPEATLSEFDAFLRDVWFDEGSTPSGFDIEETQYVSTVAERDPESDEIPVESMDETLGSVIRPRMECSYTYDPRRPTGVELRVFDPYPCPELLVEGTETAAATLVARNDLEDAECAHCGESAGAICLDCLPPDAPTDRQNESDGAEDGEPESREEVDAEPEGGDDGSAEEQQEESPEDDGDGGESVEEPETRDILLCGNCEHRYDGELVALENSPRAGVARGVVDDEEA